MFFYECRKREVVQFTTCVFFYTIFKNLMTNILYTVITQHRNVTAMLQFLRVLCNLFLFEIPLFASITYRFICRRNVVDNTECIETVTVLLK